MISRSHHHMPPITMPANITTGLAVSPLLAPTTTTDISITFMTAWITSAILTGLVGAFVVVAMGLRWRSRGRPVPSHFIGLILTVLTTHLYDVIALVYRGVASAPPWYQIALTGEWRV